MLLENKINKVCSMLFLVLPIAAFSMDVDTHHGRQVTLHSHRMLSGMQHGVVLTAKAVKNGATIVAQTAYEHPVYSALALGGVYGMYRLCSYFASHADLDNAGKHLNEHRHKLVNAIISLQDENATKTQEQFVQFSEEQQGLLEELGLVNNGVVETKAIIDALAAQAAEARTLQKKALQNLTVITRENVATSNQCEENLHGLKKQAVSLAQEQEQLAKETQALLNDLSGGYAAADALLQQVSRNNTELIIAQEQTTDLANKFQEMQERLEAYRSQHNE